MYYINNKIKRCSNCGHVYEPYSGGTVPADMVPERETCPNCGKMYEQDAKKVWCKCSNCGYEVTHADYKRQTGLLPPSGPTTVPPGKPVLVCPNCGVSIGLYGEEADENMEPVRHMNQREYERDKKRLEEDESLISKIRNLFGKEEKE